VQLPQEAYAADSIRSVLDGVLAAPEYVWSEVPDPWRALRQLFERFVYWLENFGEAHPVGRLVLLWAAILALLIIVGHLLYVLHYVIRTRAEPAPGRLQAIAPRRDENSYLAMARQMSEEGRFAEAVGYRFSALLLRLERQRAVRFHPSKTPAEYLREAALPEARRAELAGLVGSLYGYVFGGVPCTRLDWDRFDEGARSFA
jgi:hypothetical protein